MIEEILFATIQMSFSYYWYQTKPGIESAFLSMLLASSLFCVYLPIKLSKPPK